MKKYLYEYNFKPLLKLALIKDEEGFLIQTAFLKNHVNDETYELSMIKNYTETTNKKLFADEIAQLTEYFIKKRTQFDLNIKFEYGTDFQKNVWYELTEIPYGKVVTYSELSASIGKKNACRAVGNAVGKNPLPIIIPCHRVIKKNNDIGNYTAGTNTKKLLLELEKTL